MTPVIITDSRFSCVDLLLLSSEPLRRVRVCLTNHASPRPNERAQGKGSLDPHAPSLDTNFPQPNFRLIPPTPPPREPPYSFEFFASPLLRAFSHHTPPPSSTLASGLPSQVARCTPRLKPPRHAQREVAAADCWVACDMDSLFSLLGSAASLSFLAAQ